ncbi:helix-turn-helix domain-containing protein [Microbacterium sp. gxy059]|uniref:helix-turn-helix domain-containing protein n=1 Tax=Microbacterium sp. gxy059 TaxID=2957199 RepID=UPI003D96E380
MVRLPLTPEDVRRGERLGALLRRERGARSMLDVALDAGISPETLRKIESGRVATPAFTTVAAIATALGLSLDAIWSEVDGARDQQAHPNAGREPLLAPR